MSTHSEQVLAEASTHLSTHSTHLWVSNLSETSTCTEMISTSTHLRWVLILVLILRYSCPKWVLAWTSTSRVWVSFLGFPMSTCTCKYYSLTSLLHVNVTILDMWDHTCWLALSCSCVSNLGQSWPRSWLYHMWPWSTDHISIMYLQCNKIYRTQASKLAGTSRLSASWVPVINLDMITTTCPHACVPLALGLGWSCLTFWAML